MTVTDYDLTLPVDGSLSPQYTLGLQLLKLLVFLWYKMSGKKEKEEKRIKEEGKERRKEKER
jgi:hypothetical protein